MTRTLDGIHPFVSKYFRFVRRAAEQACDKYLSRGHLGKISFRPTVTPVEVRWERVENKLRVVPFASVPETVAWSSQVAGRERCTDILYDVMVEVGPGSKKDREKVNKELIHMTNVEPKDLHDNLHKWRFTHGR